jgi:hypothetical protein
MAGLPFCWGKVISKTPYWFFFISCESRFQLSDNLLAEIASVVTVYGLTEVTNEVGSESTLGPLAVYYVAIGLDVEA